MSNNEEKRKTFAELFPEIHEDEIEEAEARFDRYLEIVWQIFQRIKEDPDAHREFTELLEKFPKVGSDEDELA